jgi:predicted AAA+ superfamily ATPase
MSLSELLMIKTELCSLAVFRQLLDDKVVSALADYLESLKNADTDCSVSAYGEFVSRLYSVNGGNITRYIEHICNNCENAYVKLIGCGKTPPPQVVQSTENELKVLQAVAELAPDRLCEPLDYSGFLPQFKSEQIDLVQNYKYRAQNIGKFGYGKYASNRMFYVDDSGDIVPVKNADGITLETLVDYKAERRQVIDNTEALLCGKPAANILLTGDAGTGKSSTVKAVCNRFYADGLRLIEVRKDQLSAIPQILDELAENPLKFIIFIDDLSFLSDDDNFNGLKAVLEGSISARSRNVVVYATSNRRHIIREKFSDREGDEIHRNDTMQEMISLSDRFGIHITFQKPDKKTYLDIVKNLAEQSGVAMASEELEKEAERFALERGGRSARLAKQLIDNVIARQS